MNNIQVVFPVGAFGASEYDDELDTLIRKVSVLLAKDPEGEWAEKYGTHFDDGNLMIHPYCWCENEEKCPWCEGCSCPESATHYWIEGKETNYTGWMDFYMLRVYGMTLAEHNALPYEKRYRDVREAEHKRKSTEANQKRCLTHDKACPHCKGETPGAKMAGGATDSDGEVLSAPNFWHRPSGLRVWWYKYIGRSTECVGVTPEAIMQIRKEYLK